jgi:hypothetical protein
MADKVDHAQATEESIAEATARYSKSSVDRYSKAVEQSLEWQSDMRQRHSTRNADGT